MWRRISVNRHGKPFGGNSLGTWMKLGMDNKYIDVRRFFCCPKHCLTRIMTASKLWL